ncbi:Argininosuccinate lyase (plasmid) [Variovorax sp. SRS16]|uniref:tripartite tricarboxylate transporter substrate-binding protein n=1 Tax=Variovorax sp. SRS16 TaxID=282217 RepID=UPI0013161816|nr:tripartite tricarboxylate transporter substrate-binding protein [Variovorax sp. SRS16]VTU46340.1 Argininosuccinate lyase [Variovorax sp. SRS16]
MTHLTSHPSACVCRRTLLLAGLGAMVSQSALAQPAMGRIVVGFPPGGAADVLARMLAVSLAGTMASNVIVDNRVGAASRIAVEHVKDAPADGSVMLLVPDGAMMLYPSVYRTLKYDPVRDFIPVTRLVNMALVMFVGPGVPATVRTVADYVAWAKTDPKRAVYATPAAGSVPHFLGAMLARVTGLDLQPVHYKGGTPAIVDLVGGQVPMGFGSVSDGLAMVKAGKIRALAASGARRTTALPDVPTFLELGYTDLVAEIGLGTFVPARTPRDDVARLDAATQRALASRELLAKLPDWGFDISAEGPAAFAARLEKERRRWTAIVKSTGFVAME